MQHGIKRVAGEGQRARHVVQERRGAERQVQQKMQFLQPVAHTENLPQLPETAGGQSVPVRQAHVLLLQSAHQCPHPVQVLRVPRIEPAVAFQHPGVGGAVHLIRVMPEGGQAARDQCFRQALRGDGQVGRHAEPTETLPQHTPPFHAQGLTDKLRVAHDGVGPEALQVGSLCLRRPAREGPDRRGPTGAALIQQQDPEVL